MVGLGAEELLFVSDGPDALKTSAAMVPESGKVQVFCSMLALCVHEGFATGTGSDTFTRNIKLCVG